MSKYLKIIMKNGDICSIKQENIAFINTSPSKKENEIYMVGGSYTKITSTDEISFEKTCKILGVDL